MFKPRRLHKSFHHAARGILRTLREEKNFRIQAGMALVVIFFAIAVRLPPWESAVILLAIALVLVLELLNSIFERIADMMKPRVHHYVEDIKDMTAGAVLIVAVTAVLVGGLIFLPYLDRLIG